MKFFATAFRVIKRRIAENQSKPQKIALSLCVVLLAWWCFVLNGMNWGMPNPSSFATDAAALPNLRYSGLDMMRANVNKYPPLQYLFYSAVSEQENRADLSMSSYVRHTSDRLLRFRLVTAVMVLFSAVLIVFISCFWLPLWGSLLAAVLYLSNGMSVYYAHTTNMDQPYVMWWLLSVYGIILYVKGYISKNDQKGSPWIYRSGVLLFWTGMFSAVATKDQAYALYPGLIIALIAIVHFKKSIQQPVTRLIFNLPNLIGLIWGAALYVGVYWLAGGWATFKLHWDWITNQGIKAFRQHGSDLTGRIGITLDSLFNLYQAFNIPLLFLFLAGTGIWFYTSYTKGKRGITNDIAPWLTMAPAMSLIICFFQVTRFSYARFWLPVVPLACIASVYAIHFILRYSQHTALTGIVFSLLIFAHMAGGYEMVERLKSDTRIQTRETLASLDDRLPDETFTLGVLGSEFGKRYISNETTGEHHPVKVVRDWSTTEYGILTFEHRQISLTPHRFSILIVYPHLLVTNRSSMKNPQELPNIGYELIHSIQKPAPLFNQFDRGGGPPISIYARKFNPGLHTLKSHLNLQEQLLIIHSLRDRLRWGKSRLTRAGLMLEDFRSPNIENTPIDRIDIRIAIQAYKLAERHTQAEKAAKYLQNNTVIYDAE